tara:strand:+ start:284 stop:463 length:180 start_codon:yes stop_codon:yes gene_type:complete
MKRKPLADCRIYLTWDPVRKRFVDEEHHDLRPGAAVAEEHEQEKEIVIRVRDKDENKPN